METEAWEEEYDKINSDQTEFKEIEKPYSRDSFNIMAEFAETLPDHLRLKSRLIDALNKRKPFREFKYVIDNSGEYRQKWFDFKDEKLREWVKERIEDGN
jgi:hypothetical protein